jgi:2Fe-2S ferredoxin
MRPFEATNEKPAAEAAQEYERRTNVSMPMMVFIDPDGTRREVDAPNGLSVMEIAHMHDIDLEGACEGSLACSTCHVIVDKSWFKKLKPIDEDEEDMLDLAFGLTRTSRLGCQIIMSDELNGLTVQLPTATNNMML